MGEQKRRSSIADLSYPHQQMVEAMKSQLLIAFVNRLGGSLTIPVDEVDSTGAFNLAMSVDPDARTFTFTVQEKQR
jgi:cephalosporin hydroxylase